MKRLTSGQQLIDYYTKPTAKQVLLDNYLSSQQNEEQESHLKNDIPAELVSFIDNVPLSDLVDFFCPNCGSIKREGHIKKDKRNRSHKPKTQRWYCEKFDSKFTNDLSPFNYPLGVCYFSCYSLVAGMQLEAIKNGLELLAREKGESISITTDAIRRLLEHILEFIHEFEESIEQPIQSDEWQMDEMWQPMSKKNSERRRTWMITVTADSSRYLLATYVCNKRSCKNSLMALKIARSRAKSTPKVIKCDGLRSHEKAAKMLFPNAKVIAIPKPVYYGHISRQERLHKTVRLGALRKWRRFYSPKSLEIYCELARIDYNFIRTNDSPTKTPAEKAGIDFSIHDWIDMLSCALRFHIKKRLIEAHRELQLKQKRISAKAKR